MKFKRMPEPDWSVWLHVAKLTAEEAAALSMNFCPYAIKRILKEVSESGSLDPSNLFCIVAGGEGVDFKDAPEFESRLLILNRNYGEYIDAAELPALARRCGWSVPTELTAPKSLGAPAPVTGTMSESERTKLLKHIGGLALLLAEKANVYTKGKGQPNASQIAQGVVEHIADLPGRGGAGGSSLRDSIAEGIKLLMR